MPIRYIPYPQQEEMEIIAKWGEISGVLSNQSDISNALAEKSDLEHTHDMAYEAKNPEILEHIESNMNPHNVSKNDVGLSELDNLKQLNRLAGDFISFSSKAEADSEDALLIEDSSDSFRKKYIRASALLPKVQARTFSRMCHFTYRDTIHLQMGDRITLSDVFPCLPGEQSHSIKSIYYSLKQGDSLYADLFINDELLYEDLYILRGKGEINVPEQQLNPGDSISIDLKDNHLPARYLTLGVLIEYEVLL